MGIYDSKSYTDFCFLFCVDMIKPKKFLSNFQGFIILIYLPFLSWESYFRHTILSMMLVMTVVMTVVMVMMFVMMVIVVVMSVVLAIAVIVLVPVVVIAVYPVAERIVMG